MKQSAEQIFHEARKMAPEKRDGYLQGVCGNDIALRNKVEALLKADAEAEAGAFLKSVDRGNRDESRQDPDATIPNVPDEDEARRRHAPQSSYEQPGQVIGRYKLLEQIGEGGFGAVWAAEQREPVKRRVALKIIKLGMDTKQVIARFEAERQALAMMDHPNIAKVLDAGSTETGRPYFVMELVKGVPIVDYCDTEKLDTKARLELFMNVCHAIQHAHQKGIIHRDIKPTNVLVTLHDGKPVPKVIDFGIAKATNAELTEKTIYTQHRQMIGTPAYMSPEQAEMSGLDIDTRSDIYSLGVLLYELLTGTTPFDTKSLMEAGYAEMMRIIRETEPHKPSARLSSLGATATQTASLRRADAKKLGLMLRGDLDWIVMKCLEKDRTRRYETANGLAADICRHLNDEPVTAGPPSASYKLLKFVKRNRGHVIAASIVGAAMILGIAGTTGGMLWAIDQKERAMTAESATQRELKRANEIKRLITEMLQSASPEVARGTDTTLLKGILDTAAERIARGEITDELIAAELHTLVGDVYRRLGLYREAEQHLPVAVDIRSRLLGEEKPDTLMSMNALANLYSGQGRYAEAESLHLRTLENCKRVLGAEHRQTLAAMNNLALLYADKNRYAEAGRLFLQALELQKRELGEDDPSTLSTMHNLAIVYAKQGRNEDAEKLYLRTLEIQKRVLTTEHPSTLGTITRLGHLYNAMGRYEDAAAMFEQSLPIKRRVLSRDHPWTRYAMDGLATAYRNLGRDDEALLLRRELLEILTADAEDPNADPATLNDAAWGLLTSPVDELLDPARALAFAQRACQATEWKHPNFLDTLALAQHMTGDTASAIATQKRAIKLAPQDEQLKAALAKYEVAMAEAEPSGTNGDDQ